jgi:hypothetical protein
LEVYQKNFLDFVCGNPTSTKASDKMRRLKQGPAKQLKRRKCKLKNHRFLEEK